MQIQDTITRGMCKDHCGVMAIIKIQTMRRDNFSLYECRGGGGWGVGEVKEREQDDQHTTCTCRAEAHWKMYKLQRLGERKGDDCNHGAWGKQECGTWHWSRRVERSSDEACYRGTSSSESQWTCQTQAERDVKTSMGDRMQDVPGAAILSFCRTRTAKAPS